MKPKIKLKLDEYDLITILKEAGANSDTLKHIPPEFLTKLEESYKNGLYAIGERAASVGKIVSQYVTRGISPMQEAEIREYFTEDMIQEHSISPDAVDIICKNSAASVVDSKRLCFAYFNKEQRDRYLNTTSDGLLKEFCLSYLHSPINYLLAVVTIDKMWKNEIFKELHEQLKEKAKAATEEIPIDDSIINIIACAPYSKDGDLMIGLEIDPNGYRTKIKMYARELNIELWRPGFFHLLVKN